jgi:tetratricopeptide (TPR) repeat protein
MVRRFLLAASMLLAPSLAHADWYEASSKHFVVYSDDNPDKLKAYTARLERFDQTLRFLTGTPDKPLSPMMRVHVFVVANVNEVQRLAGYSGPAGFYSSRATGPVAFVPKDDGSGSLDAQTILQHEYAHSFMFSSWPGVVFPKWFVEGFAEFVGTAFYKGNDDTLVIGKAPEYRAYGIDRVAQMPAARMLQLDPKDKELDTQTLYGRGWLLTHYAFLGGHAKELVTYLGALNEGKSIDEANKAFGNLGQLDAKLNAYGARGSLPTIAVPAGKVQVSEVTLRKLTAGEASTMKARIWSTNGVDEERAKMVVEWARTAAAAYPNDSGAQNELAEAEFDSKNYAASEAAADRALAADPGSIHALLYKGMAQEEIAKTAKVTDAARWKSIRGWFVKANKIDPAYPQPLILYYQSFEAAQQPVPKVAQDGLIGAYTYAPFDKGLRFEVGKVLLEQDNLNGARIAFETIAYGPHPDASNNVALNVLKAMDNGGKDAALKVISDAEAKAKKAAEDAKNKKKAG